MRCSKKNSKMVKHRSSSTKKNKQQLRGGAIFFEKQKEGLGCGRIAINNIAGMIAYDISGSTQPLDLVDPKFPINMIKLCNELTDQFKLLIQAKNPEIGDPFECADNENYNFPVLESAMGLLGYKFIGDYADLQTNKLTSSSFLTTESEKNRDNYVYLFNLGGNHWTSAKKIGDAYYYFDGLNKLPDAVPEKYPTKQDLLKAILANSAITSAYYFEQTGHVIPPLSRFEEMSSSVSTNSSGTDDPSKISPPTPPLVSAPAVTAPAVVAPAVVAPAVIAPAVVAPALVAPPDLPIQKEYEPTESVTIMLGNKSFILNTSSADSVRREEYFENPKGPAKLDQYEKEILKALGVDENFAQVDALRPYMARFFEQLPLCQSDTSLVLSKDCEVVHFVLWYIMFANRQNVEERLSENKAIYKPYADISIALDQSIINRLTGEPIRPDLMKVVDASETGAGPGKGPGEPQDEIITKLFTLLVKP